MLSNQCRLVISHIRTYGYITPLHANNYGITRLASRIFDLKQAGFPIVRKDLRDMTGKRYSRYVLAA